MHGGLGKKAPSRESSIDRESEAGMGLACAGYNEQAVWLDGECRGQETGGTNEPGHVGPDSSQ